MARKAKMSKKELSCWISAIWKALDELHEGPDKWEIWNDVEGFFLRWIQIMEGHQ